MDRRDFIENIAGGIFAIIAISAAIAEVIIGGVSPSAIAACIKDVFGTLVVVLIFVAFLKDKRKAKNIRESIELAMINVEKSYAPLLREEKASETANENKVNKLKKIIRYEIAANVNALFGGECKLYAPFFEIESENATHIDFYIRKRFFGDTQTNPFNASEIARRIENYIIKNHNEVKVKFNHDSNGGKLIVNFSREVRYKDDVEKLISLIDDVLFAYIAENKK